MKYKNGIVIFTVCFINIINQLNGARILAILHVPVYSHHVPFQPLWKELIKRGHELVLITCNPIPTINSTNLRQIKFNVDLKYLPNYAELRLNRKSFISFMKDDVFVTCLHIATRIFEHPEVKKLYAPDSKEKFDLIMIQMLATPALYAFADRFNAPIIGLSAFRLMTIDTYMLGNFVLPSHENTWEMESNTGTNLSFWQRLNNFYIMWNFIYTMHYKSFPAHQQLVDKYFGPSLSPIKDIIRNTSLIFVNENQITSYARPELPNIIKFHSIHVADHSEPLPQDLKEFVDNATNGFIYFSMGHTVKFSIISNNIQEIFYDVFEKLPYKVVWKYENEPLRKLKNIYITKWLPQKSLLAHPNLKLYIYQGGLQSTQEAIHHAVPLLGIPIFSDQENQVKIAINHGIAKRLNIETLTRDELESTIQEMINNKQYKKNIINLRKLINDLPYDSLNILIWWTEYVIRHKGAPYFRSTLAWQSWYQYCDNDIIVFLSFAIFLIIYSIIKIIRKLVLYMHKHSVDQKKKRN